MPLLVYCTTLKLTSKMQIYTFQDTLSLLELPSEFLADCSRVQDFAHYNPTTAQRLSAHITRAMQHLN